MATFASVAAELHQVAAVLSDGAPTLALAGATAAADRARDQLRADLPSGRFTHLNRGTVLSVDAEQTGGGAAVVFTPGDAWGLLVAGATPHRITGRRRGGALRLATGWVTGPVNHPGTAGRHTIGRARPLMATGAVDAAAAELRARLP